MVKDPYRFYTYAYLRKDRTPYYIGKGQRRRIYENIGKPCATPKDKNRIIFLKQNLTEEEAFRHEIYMIAVFGRKDLGTGILHNRTDGGEGSSGYCHTTETKNHMSKLMSGKNNSFYGKTHNKESKKKMSESRSGEKNHRYGKPSWNKGIEMSEETRKKMSESAKRRNNKKIKKENNVVDKTKWNRGENNGMYGKTHSQETREKMKLAWQKRKDEEKV